MEMVAPRTSKPSAARYFLGVSTAVVCTIISNLVWRAGGGYLLLVGVLLVPVEVILFAISFSVTPMLARLFKFRDWKWKVLIGASLPLILLFVAAVLTGAGVLLQRGRSFSWLEAHVAVLLATVRFFGPTMTPGALLGGFLMFRPSRGQ